MDQLHTLPFLGARVLDNPALSELREGRTALKEEEEGENRNRQREEITETDRKRKNRNRQREERTGTHWFSVGDNMPVGASRVSNEGSI